MMGELMNAIIVKIDDEDILEMIPDYLDNRRAELEALENAVNQKDFDTLRGLGHKMKGSGGGYGLDLITEIGGKLETAAKAHDLTGSAREIERLIDFLERVEVIA